jgi:exodeoxyribonuclease V alpha subunit
MELRNNYDTGTAGVFNGSVGVTALLLEDSDLRVLLDEDEEVAYGFDELDELTYAYAVSIHRAQGSEYPFVVIPVTTSARLMLQRTLIYTAVTRAKRMVVLVGSRRALGAGQGSSDPGRRPPLHRPHRTAPAGTAGDGCGGQPVLERPASTGSGRAQRSGSAIGSGRQDGQGDARAARRIGHQDDPDEG